MTSRIDGASRTAVAGRYLSLGRQPRIRAGNNAQSWEVITAMLSAYGGAEYVDLAAAVSQHRHPAGGFAFVDYCIRNGWLRVDPAKKG